MKDWKLIETIEETMNSYRVVNGTAYQQNTRMIVIEKLESARLNHERLVVEYGDRDTGQSWGDCETGYIGRSTGTYKIPLSIYNKRSYGVSGILDHCIVRIMTSRGKHVLWQHPTYKEPNHD